MGTILAFGDSNTYGWHEDGRFPRDVRWPGALEALLPAGWRVVEEGLGGRTTNVDDPDLADCNGLTYFAPCLHSHVPLDAVVLFLGVNDLKPHLERTPAPRVVVLASHGLAAAYADVDAEVLDLAGVVGFRADDPRHLDANGHRTVARAGARQLALREPAVRELRGVVTAEDYDEALRFYRDALGLEERAAYSSPDGRVTILEAGRATLELADPSQAEFIDRVEVGRRVAGHIRLAFEVADADATTRALAGAGATVVAEPTRTPWDSLNARLETPGSLQVTLFEELA